MSETAQGHRPEEGKAKGPGVPLAAVPWTPSPRVRTFPDHVPFLHCPMCKARQFCPHPGPAIHPCIHSTNTQGSLGTPFIYGWACASLPEVVPAFAKDREITLLKTHQRNRWRGSRTKCFCLKAQVSHWIQQYPLPHTNEPIRPQVSTVYHSRGFPVM